MYNLLNKNNEPPSGKIPRNKKYKFEDNEWKKISIEPFKITKDSTILWFQTRIDHTILATNTFLNKIKVTNDSRCTFCSLVDETIEHLFWEYEYVRKFRNEAVTWLSHHNIHIALDEKSFLFGVYKNQENDLSN